MKNILLTIALFSVYLSSETIKITGTKPVDEGQKLVHQEDTIKGSEDINNSYEYKTKSLKKIKNSLTIKREDISHAPFKLLKYNDKSKKIETLATEEKNVNSINFNIKTSTLKEGDRLLIINDNDSNFENSPLGKEVIIEIEIIE